MKFLSNVSHTSILSTNNGVINIIYNAKELRMPAKDFKGLLINVKELYQPSRHWSDGCRGQSSCLS